MTELINNNYLADFKTTPIITKAQAVLDNPTTMSDLSAPVLPTNTLSLSNYFQDFSKTIQKPPIISVLEKESPAYFYILKNKDKDPNDPNGTPKGKVMFLSNKFLLTGVQEMHNEKVQILETFGEPVLFFFDERTKVYTFSGMLLDAYQEIDEEEQDNIAYNWAMSFRLFYDKHLRGTKLAEEGNIAVLAVDTMLLYGYPLSLGLSISSVNPNSSDFNMTFAVIDEIIVPAASIGQIDATSEPRTLENLWTTNNAMTDKQKEMLATYQINVNEIQYKIDQGIKSLAITTNASDKKELQQKISALQEDLERAEAYMHLEEVHWSMLVQN